MEYSLIVANDVAILTHPTYYGPVAVAVFVDSGYDSSADTDGSWTSDNGDTEWYGWQGALKQATRDHADREAIWSVIDKR